MRVVRHPLPILSLVFVLGACSKGDEATKPQDKDKASQEQTNEPKREAPAEPANDEPSDPIAAQLTALAAAANCDDPNSLMRVWCIATTGWATGDASALPEGDTVMAGVTVELEQGKSIEDALIEKVSFSALALHGDGDKRMAKITKVIPENEAEAKTTMEAVIAVTLVFKDKAPVAKLPADIVGYLETLPAQASYEITKRERGWTWEGASSAELRKVGEHWVAIETPTGGPSGIFVTIFTDKTGS
jgi:hypothetical protein